MPLAAEPSRAAEPDADARGRPPTAPAEPAADEHVKVVGPLRIGIPLFNIYLNEADELSRRLTTEVAEWAMELHRPVGETPIALAHSLAGSSATVGFTDLSQLARSLEHALTRIAGDRPRHATRRRACSSTPPRRSAACCTSSPPAS